jgi:tRNA nucleotidyltransferase (CCA-adding enzyme)
MDLANKILSDPINQWLFSYAKKDIFLVGGYIRDLLLDRCINRDKDYVLKDNIRKIAIITSNKFNGTFIELNKKNQMFRVALKDGQFLDFSYMQNTIVEDLGKRDFRMNAMAWAPVRGLVDPFDGKTDLKNKIIRIINPKNLAEDPLRVLRAYRLAAQLRFTIDIDTRNYLRKYSSNIKETASERITEELFKLLMTDNASYYMSMIEKDKVFNEIFNVSTSRIKLNIVMLAKFDQFLSLLRRGMFKRVIKSRILSILDLNIGQGLSRIGFMRLTILLNKLNGDIENKYGRLKYSKLIVKRIRMIHNGLSLCEGRITDNKLYDIFNATVDCEYEAALLISVTRHRNVDKFLKRADNFIKFKKNPLLDGHEIQKILNIEPSALIGKIQSEIHKKRFLAITRTKAEAKLWIISNFT